MIDNECSSRHYLVCPLLATIDSDKRSIITLDDVLECKPGLRPLISLEQRIRLALAIAFGVLQLSKTPWIPKLLTRKDVHFFKRSNLLSYEQPFLLKALTEASCQVISASTTTSISICALSMNPTLFALGILLLEIILGGALDQHRQPNEQGFSGDEILRNLITARRLLEQRVALINPVYKAVVELCKGCTASCGLDEDNFREAVYNDVIMELESILEYIKLGP